MRVIYREIMVDYVSKREFEADREARAKQGWSCLDHYENELNIKYHYTAKYARMGR